jgi:hypothetical protein
MAGHRSVGETLREAVRSSGATLYAVSRDSGVPWTTLNDFVHGQGLQLRNLEKLCAHFGLRLVREEENGG